MWLSDAQFCEVVTRTPLVAIDLLVRNRSSELLLGMRLNRPARGSWFVPGGRVRKDETLDAAFLRLTEGELGRPLPRSAARPLGVFEHLYPDSVFADTGHGPTTHYVVLAYLLSLEVELLTALPTGQHGQYRWWSEAEIRTDPAVHEHTRAYLDVL